MSVDIKIYDFLIDNYIYSINDLLDFGLKYNILPTSVKFSTPFIKKYIKNNCADIVINSIKYILDNKEVIINFDNSDDDDDNATIHSCLSNHKLNNSIIGFNNQEIVDIIMEIKHNSLKLGENKINLIKEKFITLIYLLEELNEIFTQSNKFN